MSTATAPSTLATVLADLSAEGVDLDALVSADGVDLATPTPAPGWTVGHQLGHLRWTDDLTVLTCSDPAGFRAATASLTDAAGLARAIEDGARLGAGTPSEELLASWRAGRVAVLDALCKVPSGTRLEWIGPPMGAGTMASARIMETWAHGQDIADALGVQRTPTDRLRHVADLGFAPATMPFAPTVCRRRPIRSGSTSRRHPGRSGRGVRRRLPSPSSDPQWISHCLSPSDAIRTTSV